MNTLEYLEDNKIALLYGMTHLEGIGCTRAQTEDIIEYGKTNNVPPSDIQKIINFKHAFERMADECRYPVELGALMEYNELIGMNDDTHANPGCIREDRDIPINDCAYTAPRISFWEAEQVVNEYRNYNDPLDQFAYLVLELPKRQIFYNGNKRTALLAGNQQLCYHDVGCIFVIDDEDTYHQYIELLLAYYVDDISLEDAMEEVKCFLV